MIKRGLVFLLLLLCIPVVAEAKMEVVDAPLKIFVRDEKKVITYYDDFLKIISIKEHAEKLRNKAMAENGVLIKLNGEKDTIIKIQADQIQACEAIVTQQEQLGSTQDQINQAVEMELKKLQKELARETRLSRYKSETVWIGLIGLVVWVLN